MLLFDFAFHSDPLPPTPQTSYHALRAFIGINIRRKFRCKFPDKICRKNRRKIVRKTCHKMCRKIRRKIRRKLRSGPILR